MKKQLARMLVVAIVLLVGAIIVPSGRAADATAGKSVFSKKCQICHGPDGNGNPGMAAALHVTFVPLSSDDVQKMSDDDIKKIITQGKGKMRPVQGLSGDDMDNVIAFIHGMKKK